MIIGCDAGTPAEVTSGAIDGIAASTTPGLVCAKAARVLRLQSKKHVALTPHVIESSYIERQGTQSFVIKSSQCACK